MKPYVLLIAVAALGGARLARSAANEHAVTSGVDVPYAPSPGAAPIITLGYRELAADLFFVRLVGYFGSESNTARGLAALAEATVALDPGFRRPYEVGAIAMGGAHSGVDNSIHLRAIALLEAGARAFPDNWRFPNLAGQIYIVDLQTKDPQQRRDWDQKGTLLLEAAARKPNGPAEAASNAAFLQTKLGQHERAVDGLREMLLITSDEKARARIIETLGKITEDSRDAIVAEILEAKRRFDQQWTAERPALPANFYVLLGPPLPRTFDLADLALGGREPIVEPIERLEPLE